MNLQQTAAFRKWEAAIRDRKARALIAARLLRLTNGLPGDIVSIGGGVSELRIHYGPGYRVYFMRRRSGEIVLLNGGLKGSQVRDIERARQLAQAEED